MIVRKISVTIRIETDAKTEGDELIRTQAELQDQEDEDGSIKDVVNDAVEGFDFEGDFSVGVDFLVTTQEQK